MRRFIMEATTTISQLNSMQTSTPSRSLRAKERPETEKVATPPSRTDRWEPSAQSGELAMIDPRERILSNRNKMEEDTTSEDSTDDMPNGSENSASAQGSQSTDKTDNNATIEGFNLEDFQLKIRKKLLEQIDQAKQAIKDSGVDVKWASDILYPVDDNVQAADVPEEWNAENTSQRIVDFALSFREIAHKQGMSDEEFMSTIKDAVSEGFRLAKHDLGAMPEASAKLFNDTYELTMKKFDDAFDSWKSESTTDTASAVTSYTKSNAYASSYAGVSSGYSTTNITG